MAGGIKTGDFWKDWMIDRVYDTVEEDAQGNLNAGGLMGWTGGALGLNVDSIETQKGIDVGNKDAKDTMRQLGETYDSLGFKDGQNLTGEAVLARAKERKEEKDKAKLTDTRTYQESVRSVDRRHASETLATTLKAQSAATNATLTAQNDRFAHTSEQNALQRRHDMERADKRDALSLQMQVMQNDLAEKRMDYDRETSRMDKRSAAIAQLMSGLGSLGGAFSL